MSTITTTSILDQKLERTPQLVELVYGQLTWLRASGMEKEYKLLLQLYSSEYSK